MFPLVHSRRPFETNSVSYMRLRISEGNVVKNEAARESVGNDDPTGTAS
jgi:hypothetical protein